MVQPLSLDVDHLPEAGRLVTLGQPGALHLIQWEEDRMAAAAAPVVPVVRLIHWEEDRMAAAAAPVVPVVRLIQWEEDGMAAAAAPMGPVGQVLSCGLREHR